MLLWNAQAKHLPSLEHIETVRFFTAKNPAHYLSGTRIGRPQLVDRSGCCLTVLPTKVCETEIIRGKLQLNGYAILSLRKDWAVSTFQDLLYVGHSTALKKQFSLSCFWLHRQHGSQAKANKEKSSKLLVKTIEPLNLCLPN